MSLLMRQLQARSIPSLPHAPPILHTAALSIAGPCIA
jgi:hypothetical protein